MRSPFVSVEAQPAPAAQNLPGSGLTVFVLLLSSLTVMANATISPSLPGLSRYFSDTPGIETLAGLVVSLPSLAIVLTAAGFGWAADRFDRSRLLTLALMAYALGGASGLFAQNMPQILAGRLILGVGVAGTLTIATQIATDHWQGPARARFMGRQGATTSMMAIVSLLIGGALAEFSWRGPFAIYGLALPLAVWLWFVMPKSRLGITASMDRATAERKPFPWKIMAMTGGVLFTVMTFIFLIATRLPFLLNEIGETSPAVIGVTMAMMTVAGFPTGLFYGRIRARFGPPQIAIAALLLMAAGYLFVSFAYSAPMVGFGILVTGTGLGAIIPNQTVWLMAYVPEDARGRASGLMTTLLFAGQFASPFVSAALLAHTDLHGLFFWFALGALLVATLLTVNVLRSSGKR